MGILSESGLETAGSRRSRYACAGLDIFPIAIATTWLVRHLVISETVCVAQSPPAHWRSTESGPNRATQSTGSATQSPQTGRRASNLLQPQDPRHSIRNVNPLGSKNRNQRRNRRHHIANLLPCSQNSFARQTLPPWPHWNFGPCRTGCVDPRPTVQWPDCLRGACVQGCSASGGT